MDTRIRLPALDFANGTFGSGRDCAQLDALSFSARPFD
jgi:hypothetical protein